MDQALKRINGFIVSFTSIFDQLNISLDAEIKNNNNNNNNNKKKTKKSSLKTVNFHREGIYTSFKLKLSALTEVVQ